MSTFKIASTIAIAGMMTLMTSSVVANEHSNGRDAPDAPVVYVTSQGLYYDSIVLTDFLPFNETGNFQKLEMEMDGLQTEFGPGDTGYYGGRWWVDVNGNKEMDDEDNFFSCPLLPPGRETP